MSVLADILTGYAAKIAALSVSPAFVEYPANREPKDPDASLHRKFMIDEDSGTEEQGPLQMGGTGVEVITPIILTVHWEPADAESTIRTAVADDTKLIREAMLAASNRPAGCRLITLVGIERESQKRPITKHFRFEARYIETGTYT